MTKPKLNEAVIFEELGAVAAFARSSPTPRLATTPANSPIVTPPTTDTEEERNKLQAEHEDAEPAALPATSSSLLERMETQQAPTHQTAKQLADATNMHPDVASTLASKQARKLASMQASYPDDLVESIRRTVKVTGKEVSYVRLTTQEKDELIDVVYNCKSQDFKTTENEVGRIAVNFVIKDYKANGADSILARVLKAC
jgi:hypothetical protein